MHNDFAMRELFRLHASDEARKLLEDNLPKSLLQGRLEAEQVNIADAIGRIVAEDILFPVDLPPFSRSIMDGFAVRAQDAFGATEGLPAQLTIAGEVRTRGGRRPTDSHGLCRASAEMVAAEYADFVRHSVSEGGRHTCASSSFLGHLTRAHLTTEFIENHGKGRRRASAQRAGRQSNSAPTGAQWKSDSERRADARRRRGDRVAVARGIW